MSDIVLTTLNARYTHAAFGLRYLLANMGTLAERTCIIEFDINQRPVDVLEALLARNPRIIGIGVYIWNVASVTQLVGELKRVRPDVTVIVGGPEVSYEVEQQEICRLADYVITGEADLAFGELCEQILTGKRPLLKIIAAELPEFGEPSVASSLRRFVALPYPLYNSEDLAHRTVYVEASRGCPFKCEFCLSSLDVPVRNVPLDAFLRTMDDLLQRGLRQFKFVDRTFNLNLNTSKSILQFFRERYTPGLFLHFEMIPDRLPEPLRDLIRQFPPAALQFEVGVQTFNSQVMELISRKQDNAKLEDNLRFLRAQTGVHVHADLIVGLPGEDIHSFADGFDRLVALDPQEIQVGMLKRLRGTPIVRHDAEWGMAYSPHPPYEILQTKLIDFPTMQRLRRFARYWDLVANSGNFVESKKLIWKSESPFEGFLRFSDYLFDRIGRQHGIALQRLAKLVFDYLGEDAGATMVHDFVRAGREVPDFLRTYARDSVTARRNRLIPSRQARHLGKEADS